MQSDVHSEFEIVFTICFISKLFLYKIKCLCIRWGTLDCLWWREGQQQKVWCKIFVAHLYTWVCEGDYSPMFEKERVLCVCVSVCVHAHMVCVFMRKRTSRKNTFFQTHMVKDICAVVCSYKWHVYHIQVHLPCSLYRYAHTLKDSCIWVWKLISIQQTKSQQLAFI